MKKEQVQVYCSDLMSIDRIWPTIYLWSTYNLRVRGLTRGGFGKVGTKEVTDSDIRSLLHFVQYRGEVSFGELRKSSVDFSWKFRLVERVNRGQWDKKNDQKLVGFVRERVLKV